MDIPCTPFGRQVTIEKLKRDVENIKKYARFVIVIDKHKSRLIDNGHLRKNGCPYAMIIAVLGAVKYKNVFLDESILLEIGYSRTRPYAQIERGLITNDSNTKHRWFIKPRLRVSILKDEDLAAIYPLIEQCMAQIVLEHREKWKIKEPFYIDGPRYVEKGIYFTVHRSDKCLYEQMILEDVRYRKERYLSWHSRIISRIFRDYKYSSYTYKQLSSFRSAQKVAKILSQEHYTPFYRMALLCKCFTKGSHTYALLELTMESFGIDMSVTAQEERILRTGIITLPELVKVRCYHRLTKRTCTHNMYVFEVSLERRYRERVEVQF